MNKAFKRTKFNIYKWISTITVGCGVSLRLGDIVYISGKKYKLITKITADTITIFNEDNS